MNHPSPIQSAHTADRDRGGRSEPIELAVVNNMPDPALQSTERQFRELIAAAADGRNLRVHLFSFPELIRGADGRAYVAEHYESIEQLWAGRFDGLVVTGAEPRTDVLSDEVYWNSLTRLIGWASDHTTSTIWSCLAAHAAVLHLDGIERRRYASKLHGVFACKRAADHPLFAGLGPAWRFPHSRLNTLPSDRLAAAGYKIVSASNETDADAFVKDQGSLFLFLQGHPEYDPGALYREYRRDVGRFLAGTVERYPAIPRGYLDPEMTRVLEEFRSRAEPSRRPEQLDGFPTLDTERHIAHHWRAAAVRLYSNWLDYLAAHRASRRLTASRIATPPLPARSSSGIRPPQ
ncbi:MAG TPA: homoserine O-succinyltransferase [Gemmatimonadaceae bacterium]|nr:homoserine O-succinyltransferase [Gemmatimonadaceae bacterium]